MRLANASRIRSIDFAISGISGTGSLSARARRTLAVYVALAKLGHDGISAPMGAIADAVYRSSYGEAGSIRTLQRSHVELESAGFVRLANYRPHKRTNGALIYFNMDAFAYWTGRSQSRVVSPLPMQNVVEQDTVCDNQPHTTSCRPSDRTKINLPDPNIIPSSNKEPRAHARSIDKSKRKKRSAVWVSVNIVLGAMRDLHRRERRAARARAKCELEAIEAGVELVNPSGVDWRYWEKRFVEFTIPVRETTAAREIVPLLLGKPSTQKSNTRRGGPVNEMTSTITAEDISKARKLLEERIGLPTVEKPSAPVLDVDAIDMNAGDLEILLEARNRARARVNCG
jgi:hypothetical protein